MCFSKFHNFFFRSSFQPLRALDHRGPPQIPGLGPLSPMYCAEVCNDLAGPIYELLHRQEHVSSFSRNVAAVASRLQHHI